MSTTDVEPTGQPFSPLVAQILTAQQEMAQFATNAVIDGLTEDVARAHATLAAIRHGIEALTAGPWTPTPEAILAALYPTADVIADYRYGHVDRGAM